MKRCTKCGVQQPVDNFYRADGTKDGLRGDCKACFAARAKARYLTTRERDIERAKRWRLDNPEKYEALRQRQRESGSKARSDRRSHLKRVHGITPEDYEGMLEAQGGGCAICGKPPRPDISLHIDHDHLTGQIRGLLCFKCNNLLGDVADDSGVLRAAAEYLDRHVSSLAVARAHALKALAGR